MSQTKKALREALDEIALRFVSGNKIQIDSARISRSEWLLLQAALSLPETQGEPVAWVECDGELVWQNQSAAIGRNLYTRPSVPAGMKLVPVEPTDAMLSVWLSETERSGGVSGGNTVPWMRAIRRYRAMLAAAPAAPTQAKPTNGEGA